MKKNLTKKDIIILSAFLVFSISAIFYQRTLVEEYQSQFIENSTPYNDSLAAKWGIKYCYQNGTCGEPPNGVWTSVQRTP